MIAVNGLALSFGGDDLFQNISFTIHPKDRIGLVGQNGAGKSTLLKLLAREIEPDQGSITFPSDCKVSYLPQHLSVHNKYTVIDATMQAFSDILSLKAKIEETEHLLTERSDYHSESYQNLLHKLNELNEIYHIQEGPLARSKAERTLKGLGFNSNDFDRPTSTFSGGWRMRIELAKILLQPAHLLLLDEPTNHLDIESITWLENYLLSYPGAVIVVSHDKKFLDTVTSRTLELSLGKIYDYKGNYSQFVEQKEERREQQIAAYQNQQKMISETQEFIERFRYKATKASQVQSRIKQLEKIEKIEIEPLDIKYPNIRFPVPVQSGKVVLEVNNVTKSFGEHLVFKDISFTLHRGERIALIGKNGEGKTTLAKILTGQLEYEGMVKWGHNVKLGYYAQNQDELFNEDLTVYETIDRIATGEIRTKLRDILGAFLFSGDDIHKKVKVLSGGERSRLAIACLLLEPYNLLILDEPTNHLDMHSKDILKQALINYQGTLIVVSHDRDFLDGLVNKIYELRNQRLYEFMGSIYDFLEKRNLSSIQEIELANNKEYTQKIADNRKNFYIEKKELDKEIKKLVRNITEVEQQIEQIENTLTEMNDLLHSNLPHDPMFFEQYAEYQKQLSDQMQIWEQLHNELEMLQQQKENFLQKL